jgi:hypothetical protein
MKDYVPAAIAMEMEILGFVAGFLKANGDIPLKELDGILRDYFNDRPYYNGIITNVIIKMAKIGDELDGNDCGTPETDNTNTPTVGKSKSDNQTI